LRRVLCSTTAFAAAAAVGAIALPLSAEAQTAGPKAPFTAILDGDVNTNFAVISGQQNASHNRDFGMEQNGWLRFFFEGTSDNGLTYGFYVRTLSSSDSITANGFSNDRESIYLRGNFGTVEIGNGASWSRRGAPNVTADWGPPTQAQNYLGPDGKLEDKLIKDANENRIFAAMRMIGSDNISEGRIEHIAWFSPEIKGFQFGLSVAPDGTSRNEETFTTSTAGTPNTTSTTSLAQFQNVVAGGVVYKHQLGPVVTASQVEYVHAQSKNVFTPTGSTQANKDVSSVHTGFKANWAGFQFAVDYTYAGHSASPNIGNLNPNPTMWGWDVGLEYFLGPWTVGGFYQFARSPGLFGPTTTLGATRVAGGVWEMNIMGIGAGYQIAPGLKAYTEAFYYNDYDTHVTVATNALFAGDQRNPHGQLYLVGLAFDW
jgi:predicted porin